ncbi:MAG: tetratricopeptide repeat protein [Deltaproteobacteria bacterium]|nr:tetratricopeptide repeat protein [Deltaproteobacteria bacterium]
MKWGIAAALVCALASSVSAQSASAEAEALFRQGRDLMKAGKLTEACAAFEQSQKLEPATTTLLNLAGCREKNGQLASAWGAFVDAERQTRSGTDSGTKQLHQIASDKATLLESELSKLTISVPEGSRIKGLVVARNNEPISDVMWNHPLPVDGGTYTITATAGALNWSTTVTIARDHDIKTIEVPKLEEKAKKPPPVVTAPPPTAPTPSPVQPEPPPEPEPAHASKLVPILTIAGGAVLIAGGVAFELSGESTYDAAKKEMTDQARRTSLESSANTKRYTAEALGIAGLAVAGVGVWLYLRHPAETRDDGVALVPTATPTSVGLSLTGAL